MHVQRHCGAGVLNDDAGLLQSDERDEQTDSRCDAVLHAGTDGIENQLAQSDERQN